MEKEGELETDLETSNKNGSNFFAEGELEEMGAVFEQGLYVLGDKEYQYISDDVYKRVK